MAALAQATQDFSATTMASRNRDTEGQSDYDTNKQRDGTHPRNGGNTMTSTLSALPVAYDLVLKGARVIDPATGTDAILDVAVAGGKIAGIGLDLRSASVPIPIPPSLGVCGQLRPIHAVSPHDPFPTNAGVTIPCDTAP
jgi:hypothetical protein